MDNTRNRIIVVGAGPVGLAFALAAARLPGAEVVVVERQALVPRNLGDGFDHRVYALSPGSRDLLQDLGVWQRMDNARIAPVRSMQVFGDADADGGGEIDFSQGSPLAFIIEHAALMNALQAAVAANNSVINIIDRTEVAALDLSDVPAIELSDRRKLVADLLVAADGGASRMRMLAGIDAQIKDYQSDAVVANFHVERGHGGVARQWFSAQGVLAWLPLPGEQISLVWSVPVARAGELDAMDPAAFSAAVAAAGNHALGRLTPSSSRARIPLRRMTANHWVKNGLALIGDAAHSIHPLAGQGANLGFADASALADELRNRSPLMRPGDLALLRRYERARREDALLMGEVTDRMRGLYLSEAALARMLRRQGLNLANRSSATKAMLIGHAIK